MDNRVIVIIFLAIVVICDSLILYLLVLQRRGLNRALRILEKEEPIEKDPDFTDVDINSVHLDQHSDGLDTEPRFYRDHAGRICFNSGKLFGPADIDSVRWTKRGDIYYADRTTTGNDPRNYTDRTGD